MSEIQDIEMTDAPPLLVRTSPNRVSPRLRFSPDRRRRPWSGPSLTPILVRNVQRQDRGPFGRAAQRDLALEIGAFGRGPSPLGPGNATRAHDYGHVPAMPSPGVNKRRAESAPESERPSPKSPRVSTESTPTRNVPGSWPATPPSNAQPAPQPPPSSILRDYYHAVQNGWQQAYAHRQALAQSASNAIYTINGVLYIAGAMAREAFGNVAQRIGTATHRVGTAAQRALAFMRERRDRRLAGLPQLPARRASPARANVIHLPEEQQRRVRDNQRRRNHGLPVNEDLPFPDVRPRTFFQPAPRGPDGINPIGWTPEQDRTPFDDHSTTTPTRYGRVRQHPARMPLVVPESRRIRAPRPGILRKRSLVATMSPATRERLLRDVNTLSPATRATLRPETDRSRLRVRFQSPIVQASPIRLYSPLADRARRGKARQAKPTVQPSPEAAFEPYVDPWARPPEFPMGRPLSAVSIFKPNLVIPPGRTESIYAPAWRKIEAERLARERAEEEELEAEERAKKQAEEKPQRIRPEGPPVLPLTEEWETRVEEAMRFPNNKKVVDTLSGDPLTKKDIATCFTRGAWLNDEMINSYLAILIDYLRRKDNNNGRHDKPLHHAFNSFFFSNLRDKGYESVRRWASRAKIGKENLLNVNTVFIPVHNSAHWTLIVVKPRDRTIEHFDSLGSLSHKHVETVKTWIRRELGDLYVDDEWKVEPSHSPQQDNGSDCGVFLLSTAKAIALNIEPLSYGANDTALLRRKIVAELMNRGLEGAFAPQGAL
ncbi:hypothetical protein BDV18DRAFT_132812 [Aspergillus unguis]